MKNTVKTINAAKRNANKGLLNAVSTLSNRVKLVYQFREAEGVKEYVSALGISANELKGINPAELVKFWKCQTVEGVAIVAKTFYKVDENGKPIEDENGNKIRDYQVFESKTKWTFKNILDLLDWSKRDDEKRPKVHVYEIGVKYDIVNGEYIKRAE